MSHPSVAGTFHVPSARNSLSYGTWNVPATATLRCGIEFASSLPSLEAKLSRTLNEVNEP